MTTNRLAILLALLLAGLSGVFLLPKQLHFQPVGIELNLPAQIGDWWGIDTAISEKERVVLGPETEFARKSYTNGRGDEIQASIVLAGQDMNTGIHRPERCLPAQGWTITDKNTRAIAIPGHATLPATRLRNLRTVADTHGKPFALYNLDYYWFVGHNDVTGSHFERTYFDIRDRLFRGYNQRWAYVTVAANVQTGTFARSEKELDALTEDFIRKLVPKIQKTSVGEGG